MSTPRKPPADWKFLVDPATGAPIGIQNWNAGGGDGLWVLPGVVNAYQYASLQAAHDALPSTGGMIVLAANTTYTLTATLTISKNNVVLWAPGWGTVIRRGTSMTGATDLIDATGGGFIAENLTIDGNGANVISTGFEISTTGTNALLQNVQVINSAGNGHVAVSGVGSRVTRCVITGLGTNLSTQRGYGIWAINHVQVTIDHNTISGTCIDGIGFDGIDTVIDGNHVFGCHTYIGQNGGQIASYGGGSNTTAGAVVSNNTVDQGGGVWSLGIEVDGIGLTVIGNTVRNQYNYGILLNAGATNTCVIGNYVINSGQNVSIDGISVQANVSSFQIIGNTCIDTQGSPTQRYGIYVLAGTSDAYSIVGNTLSPNATGNLFDGGSGRNKTISGNIGVDNVIGAIASAGTIQLPDNPVISLTGSATVTSIAALGSWTGRVGKIIPTGAVVFTAGATIGNTVTCVANVPLGFTFDGTKIYLG